LTAGDQRDGEKERDDEDAAHDGLLLFRFYEERENAERRT
jgi:hypothetical protein